MTRPAPRARHRDAASARSWRWAKSSCGSAKCCERCGRRSPVFKAGESYRPPTGGAFFEVVISPITRRSNRPPRSSRRRRTRSCTRRTFFHLRGAARARDTASATATASASRSASTRAAAPTNHRRQDAPQEPPSVVNFREPIIHSVTNVGDMPLWNFILEFKPAGRTR